MPNSIAKVSTARAALDRARKSVALSREKERVLIGNGIQRAAMLATAAGWSEIEQHVKSVFLKIPTKIWAAGVGYAIASATDGKIAAAVLGAADATASVYAYKAAYQVRAKMAAEAEAKGENTAGFGYIEEA